MAEPGSPARGSALSVVCAETPSEVAEIGAFRRSTYATRSGLAVEAVEPVDLRGYLFALRGPDGIMACARVLPLPDGDAGIAEFDHPVTSSHGMQTEVGRLAASDRSPRLVLSILALGSYWMVEHTRHRSYVAYCNPRLAAHYARVGARDLGVEVVRPGTDRRYRFVVGSFEQTALQLLGLLGHGSPSDLVRPPSTSTMARAVA